MYLFFQYLPINYTEFYFKKHISTITTSYRDGRCQLNFTN